ncbi:MAG: DUF2807 domain-containing protein [Marinilabiliaceae bacterium]|nr:DUF2807 domain-containing protein [Marinilabiliaceae bacterium]
MKLIIRTIIFLILSIINNSCEYIESIGKTGNEISKNEYIDTFDNINIKAPYQVILVQDTSIYINIEGLDYIVEGILLDVTNNTLTLNHESPSIIQKSKMPRLFIHSPVFNTITANSPGQLKNIDTIKVSSINIVVNGRGTYFESELTLVTEFLNLRVFGEINTGTHTILGSAQKASFIMEGCSYAMANKLVCKDVEFIHKSAADCFIYATQKIDATICSTGNIKLHGKPEISFVRGTGGLLTSTGEIIEE